MYDDFLILPAGGALVELTGWLVIIDYRLFIVADARDKSKKIEFFDSAVIFFCGGKDFSFGRRG